MSNLEAHGCTWQGEDVALALAEVLNAWRKGSGTNGSGASLMSLACAFEPLSNPQQPPGMGARARLHMFYCCHHYVMLYDSQPANLALLDCSCQWSVVKSY